MQAVHDRIIDLAFQAFLQRGFKAVSMDLVASRLRISKKTIYKHFDSKEELLESGLQKEFGRYEAKLAEVAASNSSLNSFNELAAVYLEFLAGFNPHFRNEIKRDFPYLNERIELFERQFFRKAFSRTAKKLRSKGKIKYTLPTKELAQAFLGLVKGLAELPEEHRIFVIMTFFKGLAVPQAPSAPAAPSDSEKSSDSKSSKKSKSEKRKKK